jgi:rhodanese-related sulfurtransferase
MALQQLPARALADWLASSDRPPPLLLDVREPWEWDRCSLAGARHMSMNSVPVHIDELDPAVPVVVVCHHGVRSFHVASFLERNGFDAVFNLQGGVDAWAREVDPSMPVY